MARLPAPDEALTRAFGPHLNYEPPGGFARRPAPDRKVNTHCCFCGQQCGVTLLVKDEKVIGVEPWEEFPFNQGKLCPKGVKRYLQGSHPDRLLTPLIRTPDGFRQADWPEALDLVAKHIGRIQEQYGRDAFALLDRLAAELDVFDEVPLDALVPADGVVGAALHEDESTGGDGDAAFRVVAGGHGHLRRHLVRRQPPTR